MNQRYMSALKDCIVNDAPLCPHDEDTLGALALAMRVRADSHCPFLPAPGSLRQCELIEILHEAGGMEASIAARGRVALDAHAKETTNAAFTWLAARNPKVDD
jgi:hypothetical protein